MNVLQEYKRWLNQPDLPERLRSNLIAMGENHSEIQEHFGETLKFGTGGMRALLGPGPNRMNIYTVRKTSHAFAQHVLQRGQAKRGIVIGYDPRHMSKAFAEEAGRTIAATGARAFVSPYLCPTPEVSFSVRHLRAAGGVMITASHNPKEYNGYKAFGADGSQLLPEETREIRELMEGIHDIFDVATMPLEDALKSDLFQWIPKDVRRTYINTVVEEIRVSSIREADRATLSLVYTPLYGTGTVPVQEVLKKAGYNRVSVVDEQLQPNGDFPGLKTPNPGKRTALEQAIEKASQLNVDIVLGTDPDADRVGVAVRTSSGEYQHLSGNQIGGLLTDFLLRTRKMENRLPTNGIVFKSIVSSTLAEVIASSYGIPVEDTLTGFKYIGSGITEYEHTHAHQFVFGFEESYGYLISPIVRDKDAVQACLAIAEMATFHKSQERTLMEALHDLFSQFGYFEEKPFSVRLEEKDMDEQIQSVMDDLRQDIPIVRGVTLKAVEDYRASTRTHVNADGSPLSQPEKLTLPQSNVMKFLYEDGSWMAVRPSGTEPKIKCYFASRGTSQSDCEVKMTAMQKVIEARVK